MIDCEGCMLTTHGAECSGCGYDGGDDTASRSDDADADLRRELRAEREDAERYWLTRKAADALGLSLESRMRLSVAENGERHGN